METLEIRLELDDELVHTYQQASQDVQTRLRQEITRWLQKTLRALPPAKQQDPWIDFLTHIQEYAVDTGIEDLSLNHEHYLYGGPKRS